MGEAIARRFSNEGASVVINGTNEERGLRLYVTMTRARDEVRLLYSGEASEFLSTKVIRPSQGMSPGCLPRYSNYLWATPFV